MNKEANNAYNKLINRAACHIKQRPALFVFTGAGMSVDSGLKDFRGIGGLIEILENMENKMTYRDIINPIYFHN